MPPRRPSAPSAFLICAFLHLSPATPRVPSQDAAYSKNGELSCQHWSAGTSTRHAVLTLSAGDRTAGRLRAQAVPLRTCACEGYVVLSKAVGVLQVPCVLQRHLPTAKRQHHAKQYVSSNWGSVFSSACMPPAISGSGALPAAQEPDIAYEGLAKRPAVRHELDFQPLKDARLARNHPLGALMEA